MSTEKVGTVVSGSGYDYDVKFDRDSKIIYVSYAGWTNIGKGDSDSDAMRKAEEWLQEK